MASRHEQVRPGGAYVIPPRPGGRTGIIIRRAGADYDRFQAHFLRYEGETPGPVRFMRRRRSPEEWYEIWPRVPLQGPVMADVRAAALEQLPRVAGAESEEEYERHPYVPPPEPERLETIDHPSGLAKAQILRHAPDRFEVRYFTLIDLGSETDYVRTAVPGSRYFDAQNRPIPWETLSLADSLESARTVAAAEMEQVVEAIRSGTPQDTLIQRVPRQEITDGKEAGGVQHHPLS